jgi:SNF2 family DNA or RNA helicase
MQYVNKAVLGSWPEFDRTFIKRLAWGQVERYINLDLLHRTLAPVMARATWEDPEVASQMPKVVPFDMSIDFDAEGARLYRKIRTDLMADLEDVHPDSKFDAAAFYGGINSKNMEVQGRIMSKLMCLRMLCDHPELLRISADHYGGKIKVGGLRTGSAYAHELFQAGLLERVKKTPKLDALKEHVTPFIEESLSNKVVIFSFFKDCLKILQQELPWGSVTFSGDLSTKARGEALERFEYDDSCRLFLSSDAGGEGIDLPFANMLVNFDLPFSFGRWQQRNARIIRLSSEFSHVNVVSMCMTQSIEERLLDALLLKSKIGSAILDGKGLDAQGGLNMDLISLKSFLKETAV